jgi:hypothetical protein
MCVVSANAVVPAPVGGSMAVRNAPGYGVRKRGAVSYPGRFMTFFLLASSARTASFTILNRAGGK